MRTTKSVLNQIKHIRKQLEEKDFTPDEWVNLYNDLFGEDDECEGIHKISEDSIDTLFDYPSELLEEFNSFSCFSIGDYVKHSYDVGLVKINPDPHAKDSVISLSSIAERMALHPEPEIAQEIAENYDILLEEKDLTYRA